MTNSPYLNQSVVITGASSGIGEALAYELARQGAWLTLAARRLDNLTQIAEKCRALGGKAVAVQCDVADKEQCAELIQQAVQTYGRLDTLVNNAGVSMWARFSDLQDPALIDQIMRVNFNGAVYCTYYALPHLKQSRGRIACISSMAEKIFAPGNTGYAASKRAMNGFFESLRPEISDDGISITILNLGFIDTGIAGRMLDSSGQQSSGIQHMLRRAKQMSPEDAAKLIAQTTADRKREVFMPVNGIPGVLIPYLKLLLPHYMERISKTFMERSGL